MAWGNGVYFSDEGKANRFECKSAPGEEPQIVLQA